MLWLTPQAICFQNSGGAMPQRRVRSLPRIYQELHQQDDEAAATVDDN